MTGYFKTYRGKKWWDVKHPAFGEVPVCAPDEAAAIAAAADVWGQRWQDLQFYAYCSVEKRKEQPC